MRCRRGIQEHDGALAVEDDGDEAGGGGGVNAVQVARGGRRTRRPMDHDAPLPLRAMGTRRAAGAASAGGFGKKTFSVSEFLGDEGKGTWRLSVADGAAGGSGTLNGWSVEIKR